MPVLDAFKIKPFDLEPIYAEWTDGPKFMGNPKKDPPIEEWLDQIKAGCIERNIPEEYWYKVAQHFMGPKAKARLDELKEVISKVQGGKYRWTWKKFRVAVASMGWTIEETATETIKVQGKSSGLWFMRKKEEKEDKPIVEPSEVPKQELSRSNSSFWLSRKPSGEGKVEAKPRPTPTRSATESSFWPAKMHSKDDKELPERPGNHKIASETAITTTKRSPPTRSSTLDSVESDTVTTITKAPIWLLNACNALDFITSEHPKAMSVLSAILITAGSLPAIPAITAGAGGAVLASGAAHAIGAIAVGLGQALNSSMKNAQNNQVQASSTTR